MAKTNKELAVDIALKVIEVKKLSFWDINKSSDSKVEYKPIDITCDIIKGVYKTLEELDNQN